MKNVVTMTNSQKLDLILSEMFGMKTEIVELKTDMSEVKTEMAELKTDVSEMKLTIDILQNDIKNINLTLENEICVNIQRIAEGHLDLARNLKEAQKPSQEVEVLALRVNTLEREVGEIKRKIS